MKKRCAHEALKLIKDGMVVGLGGGTTISYLVEFIQEKNLDIKVVSPSMTTLQLCIKYGLIVLPTWSIHHVDIAFDGCDEVDLDLNCLKSGGAIHTKEKIIASMADEYILLVDESKVYEKLPFHLPIALEVLPDALSYVMNCLSQLGAMVKVRQTNQKDGGIISDNGNYIIDALFNNVKDIQQLNSQLSSICGIVETSLFYHIATKVIAVDENHTRYIGGKENEKI